MRTLKDLELAGRRVLVRVDFNVPLKDGVVVDDTRIRATLPTLREILARKPERVVLCSHLGRPKGKDPSQSLAPVARRLAELWGRPVAFEAPGEVTLLENLRFDPREEKNDAGFARELIARSGCDAYVNDAFGAAHRAHASVEAVARLVPHRAAGLLLEREVEVLGGLLEKPGRPFMVMLGGAKVADKIALVENILPRADAVIVGGGMAFTFLAALGQKVGASILAADLVEGVGALMKKHPGKIVLPIDAVIDTQPPTAAAGDIPEGRRGLDIGPQSVALFRKKLSAARTVFWNGPMGVFEEPAYAVGTQSMVTVLAGGGAVTVVGGGDSIAAVNVFGRASDFTHISTGGGASMEFLEGAALPGVEALR